MKKIVLTALCVVSLSALTTHAAYRYRGPYSQPAEQKSQQRGPHNPSAHQERRKKMEERRQQMEDRVKAVEDKLAIISAEYEILKSEIADLKAR